MKQLPIFTPHPAQNVIPDRDPESRKGDIMELDDVVMKTVCEVLEKMPAQFRTKDLSNHEEMKDAHQEIYKEYKRLGSNGKHKNYHLIIGKYLSKYHSKLGIEHLKDYSSNDDGALWERIDVAKATGNHPNPIGVSVSIPAMSSGLTRSSSQTVRDGHYRSLEYMLTPEFGQIRNLFESIPEIGGVYFRPNDKGITVLDLHPDSPKPRIGIGIDPYIRSGNTAEQLRPTMNERVAYLKKIREKQKQPSREFQFEAYLIREAQDNHLLMPGFPDDLRFIYSQWRMNANSDERQMFTDLLAIDIVKQRLVILELKAQPDNSALQQVQGYVRYFIQNWDDLMPFFTQVAQVMGKLYDCPKLEGLDRLDQGVIPLVAWPGANGIPIVNGGDE